MASKDEINVLAKGAYGLSQSVPASQLEEWTKEQRRIEQERPLSQVLEEMKKAHRSFASRRGKGETEGSEE